MLKRILFSILWLSLLWSQADSGVQSRGQSNEQAWLEVQTGHSEGVNSIAFSPDGRTLASGSNDKTIKLWDVTSGQQLRTLSGHSGSVSSVAFSPDGKTLASGGDSVVKLWDLARGTEPRSLTGHSNLVTSVAFSPDGKTLASGSFDATVKLWDLASGKQLRTLSGQSRRTVSSVVFSPDGKTLASSSHDNGTMTILDLVTGIRLWDVASGTELLSLNEPDDSVAAFSPDGKTLASGSENGTIKLWDAATRTKLRSLKGDAGRVNSLAFSPDGKTLASGSENHTIKLWNVVNGAEVRSYSDHVRSVAFSPDGKMLASASEDHKIRLWDPTSGTELRSLQGHSAPLGGVAFSPDGELMTGALASYKPFPPREVAKATALSPIKWSSNTSATAISPNRKTLAIGGWDQTIKLLDVASGAELRLLKGNPSWVSSLAFSPDGKMLASGSKGHTIKLWDLASGNEVRSLWAHADFIYSLVFSPDGKVLASSSGDSVDGEKTGAENTIELWDPASGTELRSLMGHAGYIYSLAFSPDGKTLASGGRENTIKLWDVGNGRELFSLKGHSSSVYSLAFTPDGKTLASGSADTYLKLWDVAGGTELASLVALDEHDWAVVTSDGLFDASPGAQKLMHYVVGMEVVTLDQMKDLYYVPGLLQNVMKGEALPKVQLFSAKDLFPEAQYQQPKPGQKTFTLRLRNRGGGIGRAQVLVNGTEVIGDARPAGFDSQAKEVTLTIDLSNVKQIVAGKENKVEVIARNAAGSLNSRGSARGTELVVMDQGKALTATPELYAIVGGVADYVDDRLDLLYSAKDSADFARALEIGATKFLGRDKVHIRLLTTAGAETIKSAGGPGVFGSSLLSGSDSSVLDATKENFRKVFAEFAAKATTNDILVVYLSGHALALKLNQKPSNPGGDTYLYLTRESYTTQPAALADENVRRATTISGDELLSWIKEIAALKKALVLDTCAAGAAAEGLVLRKDESVDTIKIRALENLKGTTGFFILMGSAGDKVSYEATPYRQGLLTYSLLEGLKGAKLSAGGLANVGQLFGYAQDRVPVIARNMGLSQQPRFLAPDVGSPFDVGLYTADEQKLFSLPSPNPLILRPSLQNRDLGYDNLKLLPVLNKALLEASFASGSGSEQSALVFVDANEMLDAFTPSGLYTVNGNQVTIKLNLIRNEQPAATLAIEGPVTDEHSKSALVKKLVAAIREETRKLVH